MRDSTSRSLCDLLTNRSAMLRVLSAIAFAFLATTCSAFRDEIGRGKFVSKETSSSAISSSFDMTTYFETSDCSETPWLAHASLYCYPETTSDSCDVFNTYDVSSSLLDEVPFSHYQDTCVTDLKTFVDEAFADQVYLRFDYYDDETCAEISTTGTYLADGKCHSRLTLNDNWDETIAISFRVTVNSNESITYEYFYDNTDCSGTPASLILATKALLSSNACDGYIKMYTNLGAESGVSVSSATEDDGLSTGAIVGIVVGCVAFIVITFCFFLWRRKVQSRNAQPNEMVEHVATPDRSMDV